MANSSHPNYVQLVIFQKTAYKMANTTSYQLYRTSLEGNELMSFMNECSSWPAVVKC